MGIVVGIGWIAVGIPTALGYNDQGPFGPSSSPLLWIPIGVGSTLGGVLIIWYCAKGFWTARKTGVVEPIPQVRVGDNANAVARIAIGLVAVIIGLSAVLADRHLYAGEQASAAVFWLILGLLAAGIGGAAILSGLKRLGSSTRR